MSKFTEVFNDRVRQIESRARAVGLTITDVCRESGVARATPDRWRKRPPKSVELVDKMEAVVEAAEARARQ